MSDQANTPPRNPPPGPAPRVFRPFAGRTGQGSNPPANAPRQGGPRPFRPFASRPQQEPVSEVAIPVATMAPQELESSPAEVSQQPAAPVETWAVPLPRASEPPSENPITVEVPAYEHRRATPAFVEAPEESGERTTPVTRELPAFPDEEEAIEEPIAQTELHAEPEPSVGEVIIELIEEELPARELDVPVVPAYAHPEPDELDVPPYAVPLPSREPPAESLIDEVDAAFISAGLPSSEPTVSDDALIAADALMRIAERLRTGDIELRAAAGSNMSSQESALATVLAALLANR